MNKKTRLIPFDWEKYKSGMKPVFRNGEEKIISIHKRNSTALPILVIAENTNSFAQSYFVEQNGRIDQSKEFGEDILLEEKYDERTFYVNVYKGSHSQTYETLDIAKDACCGKSCLGQLKVTYTDEDLIK